MRNAHAMMGILLQYLYNYTNLQIEHLYSASLTSEAFLLTTYSTVKG